MTDLTRTDSSGALTAEELATLRAILPKPTVRNNGHLIRRLLATIDAALPTDDTEGLRAAAENVSDRRTLLDDGFWVSRKEMRALDLALGREDIRTAALASERTPD